LNYFDLIYQYLRYNESGIALIALLSLFFWLGSFLVVPWVIVNLPSDYLSREEKFFPGNPNRSFWRYPYLIVKNIFGCLFILAGLAMLILPGQGLLTLALGLGLIDFPGKHHFLQRLVSRKKIFKAINRLRARAKRPPLDLPRRMDN
jgi:hypothetical protein